MAKRAARVIQHKNGWRYYRSIGGVAAEVIGKKSLSKYLGQISRPDALRKAIVLDAEAEKWLSHIAALTPQQCNEIKNAGGFDGVARENAWAQFHERAFSFTASFNASDWGNADDDDRGLMDAAEAAEIGAMIVDSQQRLRAARAKVTATAKLLPDIEKPTPLIGLADLFQEKRKPRNPKTVERMRTYLGRLSKVTGPNVQIKGVTRRHAMAFRDMLEKSGETHGNVNAQLSSLRSAFRVYVNMTPDAVNPFTDVKPSDRADDTEKSKRGFTVEETKKILEALKDDKSDFAVIWRALIYSGARSSEICQLRACDIRIDDNILCFDINREAGPLKNKFSVRIVPIVTPIKAELLALAEKVTREHDATARLFQSLPADHKQGLGHAWQLKAGRWLRSLGIVDKKVTPHSTRHAFKTRCRENGVPEVVANAMMGHTLGKGDAGEYGEGPSVALKAKALAKMFRK